MGASRSFLLLAIVILLLAFTVVAVEEADSFDNDEPQSIHMLPLTKRDLDEAFGLRKRSNDIDLTSLSLADEHELFFGGLSGKFCPCINPNPRLYKTLGTRLSGLFTTLLTLLLYRKRSDFASEHDFESSERATHGDDGAF